MNALKKSGFKVNFLYGALVIIPLAVVVFLLVQLLKVVRMVAEMLGLDTSAGAGLAMVLALLVLVVICYGVGAVVRTRIGAWSFGRLEIKLLKHVPGYKIISKIIKGFAGNEMAYPPVLAQLSVSGVGVFAMVIEENDNNTVTVFVPNTPTFTLGNLHILDRERVTYLDATTLDMVNCITEWGTGSKNLLGTTKLK